MTAINTMTLLKFKEIKRGYATGKTYEMRAEEFISYVKNKDCDGELNIDVEPIFDEDGEIVDWTADKFYELSIEEQIEMCCRREGDNYASHISYEAV